MLNLATGRAARAVRRNAITTFAGRKRDRLKALAANGAVGDDSSPPRVRIRGRSRTFVNDLLKRRALRVSVGYSEACSIRADLRLGRRVVGRSRKTVLGEAGRVSVRVKLSKRGRRIVRESGATKLGLRIDATDLAGNSTLRR